MADIIVARRDLADTHQRFDRALGERVTLSKLELANRAVDWSSKRLKFSMLGADGSSH